MASVTSYKGEIKDLMTDTHSGLVNYLFGMDRNKELTKEKFFELQQELLDDVLWLEFTRYCKDGKTISEIDFCRLILGCANMTAKKKKQMVSMIGYMNQVLNLLHILNNPISTSSKCVLHSSSNEFNTVSKTKRV